MSATPDGSAEHIAAARIADRQMADVRSNLSHTEHITNIEWHNMRERFIDQAREVLESAPPMDSEIKRAAEGLIRTAHPIDVGKHEVVRQWWDALVAAVGPLP